MKIGILAEKTNLPSKTIRYYESIGLIENAQRTANGYRDYSENDVATLRFVSRARGLGFSIKQVAALLELWNDRDRTSAKVKSLAIDHIREVEAKITELESLRATLLDLTERCHGDDRPDCPILENLANPDKGRGVT
jgi:MerR family transcriptional regulator, copper efflux regulator